MKKTFLTLIILFYCTISNAQKLEDCSLCSSKKYSDTDIIDNELFEIVLLRNEIFARHNYSFKNERLEEYYSKYDWYTPDHSNSNKKISLNQIEQNNIALFKSKEEKIKKNRSLLLRELEKLQSAIKLKDTSYIKSVFNAVIEINDHSFYSALVFAINTVLSDINVNHINWHKGKAQYETRTDNGFSIATKGIYIEGNSITIISTDPMTHSSIMSDDDAFEYPSEYHSESEGSGGAEFEFKNGTLILKKTLFVG